MKKFSSTGYTSQFAKAALCLAIFAFIAIAHFSHMGVSLQTVEARTVDPTAVVDDSTDTPVDYGSGTVDATVTPPTPTPAPAITTSTSTSTSTPVTPVLKQVTTSNSATDSVDVTANGASGTLTLQGTESFEVDWITQNATNCTLSMDGTSLSGVQSEGSMGPLDATHPYYPAAGASHTFTISCAGINGPVSGSVIVTRVASGGGGTVTPSTMEDPQPTATTGTQCGGTVDLSWGAVTGANSYIIFRDNSQIAQISGTTFTDTGLQTLSTHTYTIEATDGTLVSAGADHITTTASDICGGVPTGPSSVDITASGSQGPLALTNSEPFTVEWISQNSTNCTVSSGSLFSTGVPSEGSLGTIDSTHAYYPTVGGSRTFNINCAGINGPVSDSVIVTRAAATSTPVIVPAPVVTATTGTACGGTIDLTWNSIAGATSYQISRDGSQIAQISENTFTDTGLNINESHSYTVVAVTATDSSQASNVATATSSDTCNQGGGGTPQSSSVDITASGSQGPLALSAGQSFTVEWISQNATNCTVSSSNLFSTGVASEGSLGTISPSHPYYPSAGGSRTFTIVCAGVQGQISDSVTVTLPAIPQPPVAPTISNIATTCNGTVTLTWNTVATATSYKVFRNGTQIATVTTGSYTDTGLTASTLYSYTVKATNANGDSPVSNSVSTTIPNTCATAPTAPTIFAQTGTLCGGSVFVTWNAVSSATSYNVFRNGTLVATSSNVSFTDTGLTPGTSYSYTVQAVNAVGTSPLSNVASATASSACIVVPNAPTITATTGTQCGGTVDLSWTTVTGATSYNLYRNASLIHSGTGTTFTDTGLTAGATYVYTVKAVNSAGESAASNAKTVLSSNICPLPNPTVSLTANPSTITQGQNSTLSWSSTNATSCSAAWTSATSTSGMKVVSPATTTAYSITCTNGTQNATAQATVTVTPVVIPPTCTVPAISSGLSVTGKVGSSFSYTLFANNASTSAAYTIATTSLPAGLSLSGTTISGTPTTAGSFNVLVTAKNDCGTDMETLTITISPADNGGGGGGDNNVAVTLTANPSTIALGATSTLAWTSQNATSCSAPWTTSTSTSGNQIVSPATSTAYTINCVNATKSNSATTTIIVTTIPPACTLPNLLSPLTASGIVGQPFTYTFSAAGSTTPTFIVGTSTLPAGLTFSGNTISGTPTTAGTYTVPVTITNACGFVTDNSIIITITNPDNGGGGGNNDITVTLSANPDTIAPNATSTLTWSSTNATSCSAAWTTSTSTSGTQDVTASTTTTYSINCVHGSLTGSATTTLTVTTPGGNGGGCTDNCGGGGGGGGGCGTTCNTTSGGGGGFSSGGGGYVPMVLGATTVCDYLHDYLHIGWNNDPVEVIKLQLFLKDLEGFSNLQVNGTFDQATFDAVSQFQVKYQPDILTPWGYAQGESTGYVYILTKKKINEIFCQHAYPLNAQQAQEIADFRALLDGLRANGITVDATGGVSSIATTSVTDYVSGVSAPEGSSTGISKLGENLAQVAAAIFAGPQDFGALIAAILILLAVVLASYTISRQMIEREKYAALSPDEKRMKTLFAFIGCLIVAILISCVFGYYTIVLPLLLLIIIMAIVILSLSVKKPTPVVNSDVILMPPAPEKLLPPVTKEEPKN